MYKATAGVQILLGAFLVCAAPCFAADESPTEWQKQSLKGVTAVRYGVADGASYDALKDVTAAFAGVKSPTMKSLPNVKADYKNELAVNDARVVVVAQNREKDQVWVGLAVEQQTQLKRNPAISYASDTYRIGKMVPRAKMSAAVKEVCSTFAKDLATTNAKK